jgi:dihydrolipoamide dehydrogenase
MPSKILIEAANAFHRRHSFETFGIRGAKAISIDIPAVLRRVRELRDDFVSGTLKATENLGERNIAGRARMLGPQRIEVDGREIRARTIIIATGSRPVVPKPWRDFGDRVLTTDTLFEQKNLPSRIAVVGMGAIGVEIAQALSRLGIEVHGFDTGQTFAGLTDTFVNETFGTLLRDEFAMHLGAPAELSAGRGAIRVGNGKIDLVVDCVLAALGRRPNIDGLGLETLGVALDDHGMVPVDRSTMQVADLPVFFAGDASGHGVLHEAADEGHIAGLNAVSDKVRCFKRRTPLAIVFADPNVAMVGKRYTELDASTTVIGEVSFARQGRARAAQHNNGTMRIYAERSSGLVLGAEMCAPAGEHLAHILALAIDRSLKVHDLLRMSFYHPVLEEGMRTALRDLAAQLPGCGDSDLAACEAYNVEALD